MSKTFDVVIAGDIFCDLIFTGLPRLPETGEELFSTGFSMVPGGIYNTAVTLRRLGLDVGTFCYMGDDPFSRFLVDSMQEEDLDLSLVQHLDYPLRTLTVAMSFEHDRSFVSFSDPRPLEPDPAVLLEDYKFRHVHIHYLGQLWEQPGLVELAHGQGATISLDCQCCPDVMARPDVPEKVSAVDVFMPNRREAAELTGLEDPEEALRRIAGWAPSTIVKVGKDGAIALDRGTYYSIPAMPVQVVDTTGAGDAFAGGFIYGLLSGMTFAESLKAGTICGSLSTTARGGTTHVPRLEELLRLMQEPFDQVAPPGPRATSG